MISYAQNYEDVILNRVFKTQGTGFYIDVGAAEPTYLSATKWFYDNGWSGINVEPVREFYELLKRERPRDINICCGAGASSGIARFQEYPVKSWSTFDLNARPLKTSDANVIRELMVPIKTLNEIIEENSPGCEIDFLKIDVEGWEEQVLLGIDLCKHRPTVILIEAIDRDSREQVTTSSDTILRDADYLSVYFDGINQFYLKREREDLTKKISIPPNIFDDIKLHREVQLEKALERYRIDLSARTDQVETLTAMVKRFEAESAARLEQIETLTVMVNKSEAESAARFKQIETLTAMVKNS